VRLTRYCTSWASESFPISRDPPEGGTCKVLNSQWLLYRLFPISRDPPEGGTCMALCCIRARNVCFQFLGIPPKGEREYIRNVATIMGQFPISRDPPEGGTVALYGHGWLPTASKFPISRDPPEGGTFYSQKGEECFMSKMFPLRGDP